MLAAFIGIRIYNLISKKTIEKGFIFPAFNPCIVLTINSIYYLSIRIFVQKNGFHGKNEWKILVQFAKCILFFGTDSRNSNDANIDSNGKKWIIHFVSHGIT